MTSSPLLAREAIPALDDFFLEISDGYKQRINP
jgi:hypothetical protein